MGNTESYNEAATLREEIYGLQAKYHEGMLSVDEMNYLNSLINHVQILEAEQHTSQETSWQNIFCFMQVGEPYKELEYQQNGYHGSENGYGGHVNGYGHDQNMDPNAQHYGYEQHNGDGAAMNGHSHDYYDQQHQYTNGMMNNVTFEPLGQTDQEVNSQMQQQQFQSPPPPQWQEYVSPQAAGPGFGSGSGSVHSHHSHHSHHAHHSNPHAHHLRHPPPPQQQPQSAGSAGSSYAQQYLEQSSASHSSDQIPHLPPLSQQQQSQQQQQQQMSQKMSQKMSQNMTQPEQQMYSQQMLHNMRLDSARSASITSEQDSYIQQPGPDVILDPITPTNNTNNNNINISNNRVFMQQQPANPLVSPQAESIAFMSSRDSTDDPANSAAVLQKSYAPHDEIKKNEIGGGKHAEVVEVVITNVTHSGLGLVLGQCSDAACAGRPVSRLVVQQLRKLKGGKEGPCKDKLQVGDVVFMVNCKCFTTQDAMATSLLTRKSHIVLTVLRPIH